MLPDRSHQQPHGLLHSCIFWRILYVRGAIHWLLLLFMLFPQHGYANGPGDRIEFYVSSYGLADRAADPRVDRAYRIFERVRAAADIGGRRTPRLSVLNSNTEPWAQALRDGNVVLSKGAIELCYRDTDVMTGDARLAFVLGHELAHLAKDDFWHTEVYRALAGIPGGEAARRLLTDTSDADPARLEAIRLKEAEADDLGFVYAAVAGYSVDDLTGMTGNQDFFTFWLAQTHAGVDPAHPAPEDRLAILRARLRGMTGALEFYRFGVRLLHFGHLQAARYFLEAFQDRFPSREVFSNLGYVCLQQALAAMPADRAYEFWLPAMFDVTSLADRINTTTRGGEMPPDALEALHEAVGYLQQATERDASYASAWVNQAVARLLLGDRHLALHAVEQALQLQPSDPELIVLRAVIDAKTGVDKLVPAATLVQLETLATGVVPAAVHFNLARLYALQGDSDAAARHQAWLRDHARELPAPYNKQVCGKQVLTPGCEGREPAPVALPWPFPVRPGADLYEDKALRARLESGEWQQEAFDFQRDGLHGHIYWQPGSVAVLEFDGYTRLVVLYGDDLGTSTALLDRAGEPVARLRLASGELWSYPGDWAVYTQGGRVQEVWVQSWADEG